MTVKKGKPIQYLSEFINEIHKNVGDVITYRHKKEQITVTCLITEMWESDGKPYIGFGTAYYSLEYISKSFEWLDENGEWHRFWIEDFWDRK